MNKLGAITIFLYGGVVIASGVWRVLFAEGGATGLWFGLVMGGFAWLSAALYGFGKSVAAKGAALFCLLVVGGWFTYESFFRKGFSNAEFRQLLVIVVSLLVAVVLSWLSFAGSSRARKKVEADEV